MNRRDRRAIPAHPQRASYSRLVIPLVTRARRAHTSNSLLDWVAPHDRVPEMI